jgi:hypothetical protein
MNSTIIPCFLFGRNHPGPGKRVSVCVYGRTNEQTNEQTGWRMLRSQNTQRFAQPRFDGVEPAQRKFHGGGEAQKPQAEGTAAAPARDLSLLRPSHRCSAYGRFSTRTWPGLQGPVALSRPPPDGWQRQKQKQKLRLMSRQFRR